MGLFKKKTNNPLDSFKNVQDLGIIDDLRKVHPQDIQKLNALHCDELDRKKKQFNFSIQKWCICGSLAIVGLFYLALFLSVFGFIENPTLKSYFEEAIMVLVSSVVGFALGYFYTQTIVN